MLGIRSFMVWEGSRVDIVTCRYAIMDAFTYLPTYLPTLTT